MPLQGEPTAGARVSSRLGLPFLEAVYGGARKAAIPREGQDDDWIVAKLEADGMLTILGSLRGLAKHPLCREFYGKGECEELRTWIEKPGLELRDTVQRLIQRQHWLELSSGGTAAGVFKRLSGVLRQEALDAVGSPHYNGSTAPDGLGWYFVPYHFSSEPSRSGYMLGYRFEQPGTSLLALNANVAPWVRAPVEGERRFFLALDAGISLRPRFAWLSKLDVNALYRANFVREDFVNALGPALTSYWFYDKLRLEAMVFPGSGELTGLVGFSDLPGLLSLIAGTN